MGEVKSLESHPVLFLGVRSENPKGECVVVFYEKELVVAFINKEEKKAEIKGYKEKLKAEKLGFFEKGEAVEAYRKSYGKKYAYKTFNELIVEHKKNYSLSYEDILKVKYVRSYEEIDIHNGNYWNEGYIKIDTLEEEYYIEHKHPEDECIEQTLKDIFKKKIKIK